MVVCLWKFKGEKWSFKTPTSNAGMLPFATFHVSWNKILSSIAHSHLVASKLNKSVEKVITFFPPAVDVRYLPFQICLVRCHKRSKLICSSPALLRVTAAHLTVQDRRCFWGKRVNRLIWDGHACFLKWSSGYTVLPSLLSLGLQILSS